MERRWWERPAIILNDYWLLFLLGISLFLAVIFTRGIWLPAMGLEGPTAVPLGLQITLTPENGLPTSTRPSEDPRSTPTNLPELSWIDYQDPEWGFSIKVPNRTENQLLTQIRSIEQLPDGLERMLLFADSPESTEQDKHPSETLRIRVFRSAASELSFDEWVVQNSTGYVDTLQFDDQNSCASYSGENSADENWTLMKWMDAGEYYLGLIVQGSADRSLGAKISESFQVGRCQP